MLLGLKWATFIASTILAAGLVKYGFGHYGVMHPGHKTLDGTVLYWPSSVRPLLDTLAGDQFLPKYLEQERTIDLIFPLLYGLVFIVPIIGLTPGARTPWWLALLPIVAVVADYAENLTVMALVTRYPSDLGSLPYVASLSSAVKGTAFLGSLGATIVVAILWVVRR